MDVHAGAEPWGRTSATRTLSLRGPLTLAAVLLLVAAGGGLVGWWIGGLAADGLPDSGPASMPLVILLLLVAVGGLGSAGIVTLRRARRTVDDAVVAETTAGAAVLAHLETPVDLTVFPTLEPGSTQAAAFDPLRRAADQRVGLHSPLLVVVAGVVPGDTAVWVGANLAIALAAGGRRVLLVDGRLGEQFGTPGESTPLGPGLGGVLSGSPLAEATSPGPVEGLAVLPPGPVDQGWPDEVLRGRFAERLGAAASGFEVVVALGPSLDQSADARLMAGTGLLVVTVPEREVTIRGLRNEIERIRDAGVRLLGLVMIAPRPTR